MTLKQELELCRTGNHKLEVIYESSEYYGAAEVVRWCSVCGSIVIDVDMDNKTIPGRIMTMKSPNIMKENNYEV